MIGWIIAFLVIVIIVLLFIIGSHKREIDNIESRHSQQLEKKEKLIALLRYDMSKLCGFIRHHISAESQEEFRFYYEMYGAADFVIPDDVYFVNSYVPIKGTITADQPFGDFTVYTPVKGHCYHSNRFCSGSFNHPAHIYDVAGSYRPCPKCAVRILHSPPEWYLDIKRIMDNNRPK